MTSCDKITNERHNTICPDFVLLLRNIFPVTSYFSFPKKGRGEENLFKRDGENPLFSHLFFLPPFPFFSFPLPFFGKEKYDVTGVVFLKINTNSGQFLLCLKCTLLLQESILKTFSVVELYYLVISLECARCAPSTTADHQQWIW